MVTINSLRILTWYYANGLVICSHICISQNQAYQWTAEQKVTKYLTCIHISVAEMELGDDDELMVLCPLCICDLIIVYKETCSLIYDHYRLLDVKLYIFSCSAYHSTTIVQYFSTGGVQLLIFRSKWTVVAKSYCTKYRLCTVDKVHKYKCSKLVLERIYSKDTTDFKLYTWIVNSLLVCTGPYSNYRCFGPTAVKYTS